MIHIIFVGAKIKMNLGFMALGGASWIVTMIVGLIVLVAAVVTNLSGNKRWGTRLKLAFVGSMINSVVSTIFAAIGILQVSGVAAGLIGAALAFVGYTILMFLVYVIAIVLIDVLIIPIVKMIL